MALDDIAAPAAPVIAVVGAGPAGFYAAEALLQALPDARVHLFERTAAPHGLVRYGVAPDHQKLKQVAAVFRTSPAIRACGCMPASTSAATWTSRSCMRAAMPSC
ncbi:NAD(P)-binding protein [Variovorax sp. PvP013]|uniref:NAD(P)-binding protein n=1 Tax=Variovorax sp. PvP013 TaxID=3156435 RepID=UPI003D214351